MGSAGFAPGLYHPCGFQAPPAVAQMLAEEEGFREITEEEIPMYTGDRIFLLLSRNPVSRAATHELIRSPLWQALDAAKSRHVYLIEADKWNFGDALSRWMALDAISRLLKGQSG
jgi:ABC-type Fe3+-hydroxamate transport system substrate-binding protein